MTVKLFDFDRDFKILNEWLYIRKNNVVTEVPKLGYTVYIENEPVAIGFLRMVENSYAQIDSLCTNPSKLAITRDKAIDMLTEKLLETAQLLDIKAIYCFIEDKNTLMRSKKFGFTSVPQTIVVKGLNK